MIESINENDFRRADLNLLLVFTALLKERNVTRAASRLHLGQPAVSAALARLRMLFGDPLFVRTRRGMEPTARALQLSGQLGPALLQIQQAIHGAPVFDPATAEHSFRLGMPDSIEVALAPELITRLQREAPGVRLVIRQAGTDEGPGLIDSGEIDLGISHFTRTETWQHRAQLYEEGYACLFDGGRLGIRAPISLKNYLALPHLLMSFAGEFEGVVGRALQRMGLQRRVVLSTTRFATLPFILKQADAVATLPASMARRCAEAFGLSLSPVPVAIEPFAISMLWHERLERDPAHRWLRGVVTELLSSAPLGLRPQRPRSRSG